jgi:hypothetical protein
MVLLNLFSKLEDNFKFKYYTTNTNWVDIDLVMFTIIKNHEKNKNIYWLDCLDVASLDEFVTNRSL